MTLEHTQYWSIANLGFQHFERGRLEDAHAVFEGLITVDPQEDYAWRMLGEIAHKQNKLAEAIDYLQQAIQRNANDPGHRVVLAQVYLQAEQPDEAWALLSPLRAYFQRPQSTWDAHWVAPLQLVRALLKAHFQLDV